MRRSCRRALYPVVKELAFGLKNKDSEYHNDHHYPCVDRKHKRSRGNSVQECMLEQLQDGRHRIYSPEPKEVLRDHRQRVDDGCCIKPDDEDGLDKKVYIPESDIKRSRQKAQAAGKCCKKNNSE